MRTTNPAKAKSMEVTDKVIFPDATEQNTALSESCSQMYITTPAPVTIVTAGTYYKMAGTTAAYQLVNFTHSNGRLTYTGAKTRKFDVVIPFSVSSSEKDITVTFEVYKNGGEGAVVPSRITRTLRAVGDIYVMPLASIVELAQGDYVELWGTASKSGTILTIETLSFLICS